MPSGPRPDGKPTQLDGRKANGRRHMMMFNPKVVLINAFVELLQQAYRLTYGQLEPHYPGILGWAGRMALECIASSDAL
jgi:hypothetical protein